RRARRCLCCGIGELRVHPQPFGLRADRARQGRLRSRRGALGAAPPLPPAPAPDEVTGRRAGLCSRAMSALRNTRLKRSWQDADTCSSSVELTFSTVTAVAARMVAVRLAPGT